MNSVDWKARKQNALAVINLAIQRQLPFDPDFDVNDIDTADGLHLGSEATAIAVKALRDAGFVETTFPTEDTQWFEFGIDAGGDGYGIAYGPSEEEDDVTVFVSYGSLI